MYRCFILSLLSAGFLSAYAQQSEIDSLFTPLQIVRQSRCADAVDWNQPGITDLSDEQIALFRDAYEAALIYDDSTLQSLVTDSAQYRDLYGFTSQLRSLLLNLGGTKFMYQQRFDRRIELHNNLAQRFQGFDPDVIVSIVLCEPAANGVDVNFSGGFAYLTRVDGEWKFHAR